MNEITSFKCYYLQPFVYDPYLCWTAVFLFCSFVFTWKADLQREKEYRHLPSSDLLPKWLQQPGLGQSQEPRRLGTSHGYQSPSTWAIFHCFPRHTVGSWIRSTAARTQTGARLGCQHCRLWLNLLCHCVGPYLFLWPSLFYQNPAQSQPSDTSVPPPILRFVYLKDTKGVSICCFLPQNIQ